MFRRVKFALLLLAVSTSASDAMVLSCFPLRASGTIKIDAYVDAHVPGDYPPKTIEALRVLLRMGEDVYEFFPEQTQIADVRDGALQLRQVQPLSAGETAEVRFSGKIAPNKGETFTLEMYIRNERRVAQGTVRCTIE
jgi:hypothetical protein